MESLQIYILGINIFVLLVMAAFLAKNRDLNGRLFIAQMMQDVLRNRVKQAEALLGVLQDSWIVHASKIESLQLKVDRLGKKQEADTRNSKRIMY